MILRTKKTGKDLLNIEVDINMLKELADEIDHYRKEIQRADTSIEHDVATAEHPVDIGWDSLYIHMVCEAIKIDADYIRTYAEDIESRIEKL